MLRSFAKWSDLVDVAVFFAVVVALTRRHKLVHDPRACSKHSEVAEYLSKNGLNNVRYTYHSRNKLYIKLEMKLKGYYVMRPHTTIACAAGVLRVVKVTAGRDSSRCRSHEK